MRKRHARCDMAPTSDQIVAIRRSIKVTAARFQHRFSLECIEDLVQEVLLRLWRSGTEDRLRDCPPYVRRVAENSTIDTLRRSSAKKRRSTLPLAVDPRISPWRPPRTPEEIVIAREEAQRVLATDQKLRRRVESTVERFFPSGLEEGR